MTRSQTARYHGRYHVMLPGNFEGQKRRYMGSLKKLTAYNKAHGKTGGRRHRKTRRHTRRR
jgi:hypothetical protein